MAQLSLKGVIAKLLRSANKEYKFQKGTASYTFDANTTTRSLSATITTQGRPVLIICSGDLNPSESASVWFTLDFYRGTTRISQQIDQSNTNSMNSPFCMMYLDVVAAGTYTYEARFTRGAGTFTLSEGGALQAPNFLVMEI